MFIGALLILAGAILLLDKMGYMPGDFWDYFWPVIIIALGIKILFSKRKISSE